MHRWLVVLLVGWCGAAVAAKAPDAGRPLLAVGRAGAPPTIDGAVADPAWARAACVPLFVHYRSGQPAAAATRVFAAWDDRHLHVAFLCDEPRMAGLKATLRERDAGLWGDDAVEVFLHPNGRGAYYHFIVNPLGALYDARGQGADWNSSARVAARREARRWTCELAIPWSDLGGPPSVGATWRANFTRCRRAEGEDLTSWAVTGGSFHNPEVFGSLRFVRAAPSLRWFTLGAGLPGINRFEAEVAAPVAQGRPAFVCLAGAGHAAWTPQIRKVTAAEPRHLPLLLAAGGTQRLAGRYELGPDDLQAPLDVSLAGPDAAYYRQRVVLNAPPCPSLKDVRAAVAGLRGAAAPAADRASRELPRRGEKLLQASAAKLAQARRAGIALSRPEWAGMAKELSSFWSDAIRPVIWTDEPASPVRPDTPPPSLAGVGSIDIAMARNERESMALRLRSPVLPRGLDLRLALSDLPRASGGAAPASLGRERILLREAVPVPARGGGVLMDPLCPLPPSGIVHLPAGETREVWITVDSDGLDPGYYCGTLEVSPLDPRAGVPAVSLPLRVRVWPLELPREMPVPTLAWDYGKGAASAAHLDDLARHHTNVLATRGLPGPDAEGRTDFSGLRELVGLARGKGLLFMEAWFMRETGWRPQYERWVRDLRDAMQALGIPFDQWVLHIYDETLSDEFLECAKQIKRLDPRVRIFTDNMGTAERVRQFAPYVDYWCPHCGDLTKSEGLDAMRATGKPIWTYECGSEKSLPAGRYRALPWRAWRYGLDGVSFWCYPGSAWNELPIEGFNYGHVYEGYRGEPISSKRWEAWGDGLEDYLLLHAYDERLRAAAPTPEDQALLARAKALGDANGGDTRSMAVLRSAIAHRALQLAGTPIARDFPEMAFPAWPLRCSGDAKGSAGFEEGARTRPGDLAMVVRSATAKSWTFLANRIEAKPGDRVSLSLWARGNGALRVSVIEGFVFGGNPSGHRMSERVVALSGEWQQVRVEHEVQAAPVETVVGFDYDQPGAEALLADAEVTVRAR